MVCWSIHVPKMWKLLGWTLLCMGRRDAGMCCAHMVCYTHTQRLQLSCYRFPKEWCSHNSKHLRRLGLLQFIAFSGSITYNPTHLSEGGIGRTTHLPVQVFQQNLNEPLQELKSTRTAESSSGNEKSHYRLNWLCKTPKAWIKSF